jgi:hypothetical protein
MRLLERRKDKGMFPILMENMMAGMMGWNSLGVHLDAAKAKKLAEDGKDSKRVSSRGMDKLNVHNN